MAEEYHIPVLLHESVDGLNIDPEGIYVDVTFGGGGHSRAILDKLTTGRLIAFDQDVDAVGNVINDERLIFVQHNFKYLKNFLDYYGFEKVDGVLADLGVSSHDFDVAERGFSFRFEGDLDMRMNQTAQITAADVVNGYAEMDLVRIFSKYGELKNARRTASAIVVARDQKLIRTTSELQELLLPLVSQKVSNRYMAQVFQALRIEVNRELDVLVDLLNDVSEVLRPGGRLVVISYHSLEDRLVKNLIQKGDPDGNDDKDFFGNVTLKFKTIGKKMILPDQEEIERNSRARSAKMRIAERI